MLKRLLFVLIFAEIAAGVLEIVFAALSDFLLPSELSAYLAADTAREATTGELILVAVGVAWLALVLGSSIGLLFSWPPARPLYLVATIASFALGLFFGPVVASAWESTAGDLQTLINGMILALIYFSPLKEEFEGRPAV